MPEERVETRDIKLQSDLSYEEKPVQVLDVKERVTHGRVIKLLEFCGIAKVREMPLGKGKTIHK